MMNQNSQETEEITNQLKVNEILYNCSECSSPIEILTIDEEKCSIEFNCINNNHKKKMSLKEYIDKRKKYNDYNINKDKCEDHNNNYEIYCFDCNNHLCKECLKSRNHINHHKINIAEKQPSKNEREIIQDSIKFYEEKIDNLEKEKLKKIIQIKNNYEKT